MRIAVVVPNPCNPDFRVMKQAETLASAGHQVTVHCVHTPGTAHDEVYNGVRYLRHSWTRIAPLEILQNMRARISASTKDPSRTTRQQGRRVTALQGVRRAIGGTLRHHLQAIYHPYLEKSFARAFWPALIHDQADVIHAHDLLALGVAARVALAKGAFLVYDSHELETHRSPPLTRRRRYQVSRFEAELLPRADLVTTVSDGIADFLTESYRIPRPLVLLNAPRLSDQGRCGPGLRNALPAAVRGHFILVYTGNIMPNRGLDVVIRALGQLERQGQAGPDGRPLALVAVGNNHGTARDDLLHLAVTEGIADRVFFQPAVAPEAVSRYIASADAAVLPILRSSLSYDLCMPNKLFEAIMAGLPVIVSDLTELKRFVSKNGCGLTFATGQNEALAQVLAKLTVEELRASKPTKALIRQTSWEAQERRLLTAYRRLEQPLAATPLDQRS